MGEVINLPIDHLRIELARANGILAGWRESALEGEMQKAATYQEAFKKSISSVQILFDKLNFDTEPYGC